LAATISDKLTAIAEAEDKPVGHPVEYNGLHYMHQTPGGMLSNFHAQLETAVLSHRFDELLHEVARVRSELAFPIMITPFAHFVGTQAVMNVISGERYSLVPNEIKKYVLGYYGTLLAPIDPELRARIVAHGASDIALEPGPIASMLPDLQERYPDEGSICCSCARCSPAQTGRRNEEDCGGRRKCR
jgi:oxaloacetate decarboxylase alpha subunit